MTGITDIIYTFHIISKESNLPVTALQKIFSHQISTLLIIKTDIYIFGNIFWRITVDEDNRILIFTLDSQVVIMEHTDKNQSLGVPAYYIADDFVDVFGCIKHHIISMFADRCLQGTKQFSVKWICKNIFVFVFASF